MIVGVGVGEVVGDGVVPAPLMGVDGIRVGLAVAVEGVGRSAGVVAVTTLVVPAVLLGVAAGGAVAAVGEAVTPTSDESPVQAASNNSPAANDKSTTATEGGIIESLLAMTGLPLCRSRLHANDPPRWAGANRTPWNYTLAVSGQIAVCS